MRTHNLPLDEKHYDPCKVESKIYKLWEESGVFTADNNSKKKPFTIVIPPPNVTGRLHMGHALNNTLQDAMIRYKRMSGFDALWVPGTDHAGISTQSVVKKHLDADGINYRDLGRQGMIEKIWEWKEKYGDQILLQLKRLGCSCDWSRTRFTMDEGLSKAVLVAFKRLYDEKLIYRGKYIVNWCPVDRTALSDEEVVTKDGGEPGHLWHFRYPLEDGSGHVEVATTRPETVLGDTAIAINPKDKRYKHLVGKKVLIPFVNRAVPVIEDDYVDPEFGTGCVKITPAHDPNDFQIGLRHNLEQIDVMTEDAHMISELPAPFAGLDRYECRKVLVSEMDKLSLLIKVEDRMVPIGRSYRSKAPIEYRLSDQWFVKMQPLAQEALAASNRNEVKFVPDRWDDFYRSWLEKTRDWCISRQVWWGHRIPAWYHKETGEILVDTKTPEQVEKNPDLWRQDEDVLDTWFSSALWPYSTLGWPEQSKDLARYYPNDVLVTGKDIIFFWVARMIMTGLFNLEKVPFHTVVINSIVCGEDGETMSKSKGNGIDPLHVIDGASREELEGPVHEARPTNMQAMLDKIAKRFPEGFTGVGADALRYTMLTSATDSQQMQLALSKFDEIGRPLLNKIWNGTKLALAFLENIDATDKSLGEQSLSDRWILSRLDSTTKQVIKSYESYSFHQATNALYHFFWDDLCDWYLEMAKIRSKQGSAGDRRRIAKTLSDVFLTFYRLIHPIMPFITEELWGHFHPKATRLGLVSEPELEEATLCVTSPFPSEQGEANSKLDRSFEIVQEVVRSVRNTRATSAIASKVELEAAVLVESKEISDLIKEVQEIICSLANLKSLKFVETAPDKMTVSVLPQLQLFLNILEHMDVKAEIARNTKSLEKLSKQVEALSKKLENKGFTDRAPKEVVDTEKAKLAEAKDQTLKIEQAIKELEHSSKSHRETE